MRSWSPREIRDNSIGKNRMRMGPPAEGDACSCRQQEAFGAASGGRHSGLPAARICDSHRAPERKKAGRFRASSLYTRPVVDSYSKPLVCIEIRTFRQKDIQFH
jgi:hypothetical protein